MKYLALTLALVTTGAWAGGPERAWETGIWRGVEIVRPKVVFGVTPRGQTATPGLTEVRKYVIETDDLRLELKEQIAADAPRVDATVGEPVTFALEKNSVYIKGAEGAEHKLNVTKKTTRTKPSRLDRSVGPASVAY